MRAGVVASVMLFSVAAVAAACGGSARTVAQVNEGTAAQVVAQYFVQEAAGGKLPEGPAVSAVGTDQINILNVSSAQKKDAVKARYCIRYRYNDQKTFAAHNRVYIASLQKDGWVVESVKPEGDCQGVG